MVRALRTRYVRNGAREGEFCAKEVATSSQAVNSMTLGNLGKTKRLSAADYPQAGEQAAGEGRA